MCPTAVPTQYGQRCCVLCRLQKERQRPKAKTDAVPTAILFFFTTKTGTRDEACGTYYYFFFSLKNITAEMNGSLVITPRLAHRSAQLDYLHKETPVSLSVSFGQVSVLRLDFHCYRAYSSKKENTVKTT